MYVPKIKTPEGLKPITIVPDNILAEVYYYSNISDEDREIARFVFELDDKEYAANCLRLAFAGLYDFKFIYPGAGGVIPEGARFVCSVPDGGLYLIRVPSKS